MLILLSYFVKVRLYGGSDLGQMPLAEVKQQLQRAVADHGAFDATAAPNSDAGGNGSGSGNGSAAQADTQLEVQAEV